MISSPPPESVQENNATFAPGLYRARITSNVALDDPLEDAAVLSYEYDRRWRRWWSKRRWVGAVLLVLPPLLLLIGLIFSLINQNGGIFLWLALLSLIVLLLFGGYCWYTMPRLSAFGRVYRRLVAVPLSKEGTAWCDAAASAPDFPALRDNFFALYRDSVATGARTQPNQPEDASEDEILRKKTLVGDLSAMLAPLLDVEAAPGNVSTPFIHSQRTACLDRLRLEGVTEAQALELAGWSIPYNNDYGQRIRFSALARAVEEYANPELLAFKVDPEADKMIMGRENQATAPLAPGEARAALQEADHRQVAAKMDENLELVRVETGRWQERGAREQAFFAGQLARFKESQQTVRAGYAEVEAALEAEIRPAVQQLESDADFYRRQIAFFYDKQREVIEGARDAALGKLSRELHELEGYQDERLDEQSLLQAEFKGLNDQRLRLETSTDSRFETLKNQLSQLTGRTYAVPPPPVFRSNLPVDPAATEMTTEEVLQGLAELRAESRLSINAVNSAINRYARLRFDPLDDLGQLEQELADGTKWQATRWLGNIINFRQSGQLLALAGEVSDAVGVYLDATGDFERLNGRWCNLEAAVRQLGLVSYANRLGEAQQYLVNLADVVGSLHSNLAMAPHSPEMARPATFQNLYDLAAGLQRELEELGGLAGNITRAEERLDQLAGELAELAEYIARNKDETERVTNEAANRLSEVTRKQQSLEAKLAELKDSRVEIIRGHIETFRDQSSGVMNRLDEAAEEVEQARITTDKILKKHLSRAERLLEEVQKLRRILEGTISEIVTDFEQSVVSNRMMRQPSELFVPIWFFQFLERPLWKQRMIGYATCYYSLKRFGSKTPEPNNLSSLVSFMFKPTSSLRYKLEEDAEVMKLLNVQHLDYPAGRIILVPGTIQRLSNEGWLSPWLSRLIK